MGRKSMKKRNPLWVGLLMATLLEGSFTSPAWAAEAEKTVPMPQYAMGTEEVSLPEVTVTALRYKSKNLETPADVTSYSREQLKSTGATNLADALKYGTGLIYSSMGPHGQSWGSMTSQIVIRGVEKGTLVMVNGVPINMNGYYHLESIPVEQVEHVEVLKGGGSVLYGSEALGGIINIITRDKVKNTFTISGGNDGQSHSIALQEGKSSFQYSFNKTDESGVMSDFKPNATYGTRGGKYYVAFGDAKKNNFNWNYKFDEHFSANYAYGRDDYSVKYKHEADNALLRNIDHVDESHRVQLAYDKDGWNTKAYYKRQNMEQWGTEPALANQHDWTDTTNTVYGVDTQKTWKTEDATWLVGTMLQHEIYDDLGQKMTGKKAKRKLSATPFVNGPHDRNHYALYLQWDKELSKKNRIILGAREDVVKTGDGKKFNALSPQLQFLHRLDRNRSLYFNAGKSFRMPNFTQLHKTSSDKFMSDPNLQPEEGMNEEFGYKYEKGNVKWKVAAFHVEVKDKLEWKKRKIGGEDISVATNVAKFRNRGIEASYEHRLGKHWSYSLGGSLSNPEEQEYGDAWKRTLGRRTFNAALHYMEGSWNADLSAMYYGDRVDAKAVARDAMIPVSLHVGYKLKENRMLTLDVDNLLDRRDITTNSSAYYMPGRSFRLGFTANF